MNGGLGLCGTSTPPTTAGLLGRPLLLWPASNPLGEPETSYLGAKPKFVPSAGGSKPPPGRLFALGFFREFLRPQLEIFYQPRVSANLLTMKYRPGLVLPSEPIAMKNPARLLRVLICLLVALLCVPGLAAEPTPPRSGPSQPRTGQTQKFGSGTLTHRSDGTSSQTRPFGSGSLTTERTRDGRTVTGHTQKFGSGTITRWSDGSTTETRPFGSGSLTTERGRDGKTVTGHTQKFGSGTITNRSDGSSTRTEKFGSGTLQRDQPGKK